MFTDLALLAAGLNYIIYALIQGNCSKLLLIFKTQPLSSGMNIL